MATQTRTRTVWKNGRKHVIEISSWPYGAPAAYGSATGGAADAVESAPAAGGAVKEPEKKRKKLKPLDSFTDSSEDEAVLPSTAATAVASPLKAALSHMSPGSPSGSEAPERGKAMASDSSDDGSGDDNDGWVSSRPRKSLDLPGGPRKSPPRALGAASAGSDSDDWMEPAPSRGKPVAGAASSSESRSRAGAGGNVKSAIKANGKGKGPVAGGRSGGNGKGNAPAAAAAAGASAAKGSRGPEKVMGSTILYGRDLADDYGGLSDSDPEDAGGAYGNSDFYAGVGEGDRPHFPLKEGACDEPLDVGGGAAVPKPINRQLYDFQRTGVRFMAARYFENPEPPADARILPREDCPQGCILADDMGLGKTVQMISLFAALLKKTGTRADADRIVKLKKEGALPDSVRGEACSPFLIVCPATLVASWSEHFELWGYFEAIVARSKVAVAKAVELALAGKLEVVITSYNMMRNEAEEFKRVHWHIVCFDEFHELKNDSGKTQAAAALERDCVIGLTGTPIQNNLTELWRLANIAVPGLFGDERHFSEYFSEPIKMARKINVGLSAFNIGEERRAELQAQLARFVLRRRKDNVEELSSQLRGKEDIVVFCDLKPVQRAIYATMLSLPEFVNLARAKEPCDCGRANTTGGGCCYRSPQDEEELEKAALWKQYHRDGDECNKCPWCCGFPALSKLQKIVNHPALLQANDKDKEEEQEAVRSFAKVAFPPEAVEALGGYDRSSKMTEWRRTDVCGKMAVLEKLLNGFYKEKVRENGAQRRVKVLVFSYSAQMLTLLSALLKKNSWNHIKMDGSVGASARQKNIDEFTRDPSLFVFLMSTKACGLGINLQCANRVVIYDVCWNPSRDMQAQDRAYRIGQMQQVKIYRLVSAGTMEEITYMRQLYKIQLSNAAMGETGAHGGKRMFEAIQGSKGQQGELFGMKNLLTLADGSILAKLRERLARQAANAAVVIPAEGLAAGDGGGSSSGGAPAPEATSKDLGALLQQGVETARKAAAAARKPRGQGQAGANGGGEQEAEFADGNGAAAAAEDDIQDPDGFDVFGMLGVQAFGHEEMVGADDENPAPRDDGDEGEAAPAGGGGGGSGGGGDGIGGDGGGGGGGFARQNIVTLPMDVDTDTDEEGMQAGDGHRRSSGSAGGGGGGGMAGSSPAPAAAVAAAAVAVSAPSPGPARRAAMEAARVKQQRATVGAAAGSAAAAPARGGAGGGRGGGSAAAGRGGGRGGRGGRGAAAASAAAAGASGNSGAPQLAFALPGYLAKK